MRSGLSRSALILSLSIMLALPVLSTDGLVREAQAQKKKKQRKAIKSTMTKADRQAYRNGKRLLKEDLAFNNRTAQRTGGTLKTAREERASYKKADRLAQRALRIQASKLAEARRKTGLFRPSTNKLASLQRRYNQAHKAYENGPKNSYRAKKVDFDIASSRHDQARSALAKTGTRLKAYRESVDGRLQTPAQQAQQRRAQQQRAAQQKKSKQHKQSIYGRAPKVNASSRDGIYSSFPLLQKNFSPGRSHDYTQAPNGIFTDSPSFQ